VASGLGSGAAISTALARALFQYFEYETTLEEINTVVYDIERMHHGTPSGIDNTVIVYESPVYFVRDTPVKVMEADISLHLIIANTGQTALTKESVGDVRKLFESEPDTIKPLLTKIGQVTEDIYEALQQGNIELTGKLMTENHALLCDLTVSSSQLDKLVKSAIDAGAMGAKLSGGGRGGNMIALVNDKTALAVRQALLSAGATQIFETYTGERA
ncbi:MAG: mevalonate kinase, partial [Aggregatilineales bacterium]